MTKKLQSMMKDPKPKRAVKKVNKLSKKQRLAIRGIKLHIGVKRTIELFCEHVKEQRRPVPEVDLSSDNPAAQFAVRMYSEIGKWDDRHLAMYIEGVTGNIPKYTDTASMLGTVKAIFHAIFEDNATKEEVIKYDSVWRMWPKIRLNPSKTQRRKEMATKKATAKKTVSKKGSKKGKESKKKVVKKKGGGGRLSPITDDTKLLKKKASCGESAAWDDLLDCMPKKAVTFSALCDIVAKKIDGDEGYTRRVVGSLRRRGCISAVD